jgi:phosphatidylglycerophosphate synthase
MAAGTLTIDQARAVGQGSAHLDADPTYARRVVRHVSPYLSWAIVRFTGLAADHVTALSIGAGIIGGLLAAAPTAAAALAAVALLQVAYLFDVADGEVARIRGTAGRRGTYLDLIGHVLQNRALYLGAGVSLIVWAGGATWAIVVALLSLGLASPFGLYARDQVVGPPVGSSHPDHGPRVAVSRPTEGGPRGFVAYVYRRLSFIWNYPASMNLFCLALLVDAARYLGGAETALAVPVTFLAFGPTLAAKQVVHAVRLLARTDWTA